MDANLSPARRTKGGVARLGFGHARIPGEQLEILSLRLRAHQHHGHLSEATALDLTSSFDDHSRHLVCRSGEGCILGYVRLILVDGDPQRSQYVAWGGHEVPDWLWRARFVEAGAGATDPGHQMQGLFLLLMQYAARVARQSGFRYMLGACDDHLLRMYRQMGFSVIETRHVEPKPGWTFRSHLIVLDMAGLLDDPPEGKWVAAMARAAALAEDVFHPHGIETDLP